MPLYCVAQKDMSESPTKRSSVPVLGGSSSPDEAIFLADNLVILSNKPTTVQTVIKIDLPRPRNYKMLTSAKAFKYRKKAMELLHGEAMKSFAISK